MAMAVIDFCHNSQREIKKQTAISYFCKGLHPYCPISDSFLYKESMSGKATHFNLFQKIAN